MNLEAQINSGSTTIKVAKEILPDLSDHFQDGTGRVETRTRTHF